MTGPIMLSILLCSGTSVDTCRELTGSQSFPTVEACLDRGEAILAGKLPGYRIDSLICRPAEEDEK